VPSFIGSEQLWQRPVNSGTGLRTVSCAARIFSDSAVASSAGSGWLIIATYFIFKLMILVLGLLHF